MRKNHLNRHWMRYSLLGVLGIGAIFLLYIFVVLQPRHDRNWESGLEILPHIDINNSIVSITNVRDYRYKAGRLVSTGYRNRTVDINRLERAWFVVEPFEGIPLFEFGGIAHTYFVFDFAGQKPLAVSVEARREKDEDFNLVSGSLNQFELMYVWGTEEDLTIRRIFIEDNALYMYPLTISQESTRRLFLQLVQTTAALETTPRFYNSFTSNCTNELAKNANRIKAGAIPFNIVWYLPGFAAQELHKLGYIPNHLPFEEISQTYFISPTVREHAGHPNFSELLRKQLP